MESNQDKKFSPWIIKSIPIYSAVLILLFLVISGFGDSNSSMNDMDVRHLTENDKSPVLQWLERARLDNKVTSMCVTLEAEKGTNGGTFISELSDYLESKGYQVSKSWAVAKRKHELRGVSFETKENCVIIHVGVLI